tara:strand:+ start:162 stop:350 length:189 start_codon:yes stop_codon:yes gene_type:complete
MEEMISLKKGNKIIKRSKANYEANEAHWKIRGFSLVKENIKTNIEKVQNVVKLKPKKKKRKK